jgi:hypothetical protein
MKYKAHIASSVVVLRSPADPSTVFGRVRTIVVDSIKGASLRPSTHVGEKVLKRRFPSFTHFYAPSTIISVGWALAAMASVFHAGPYSIFCAERHVVRGLNSSHSISCETPAAFRATTHETIGRNTDCRTAVAFTYPEPTDSAVFKIPSDYLKSGESFTSKVDCGGFVVVHVV